jgi:hypothetical protein
VERRQPFDLPPLKVEVTEHQLIEGERVCGQRTRGTAPDGVSCPMSSRRLLILFEQGLEGGVGGGIIVGAVAPAAPDDVCPGAGEDAYGVGMIVAAGTGSPVEISGPEVGVWAVAGEVTQGVAQLSLTP